MSNAETVQVSNADTVRRFEHEFKNKGNLDIVDDLMSRDLIHNLPFPGLPSGSEGMKAVGRIVFGAIHDIRVDIDLLLSDGDLVAARTLAHGIRKDNGNPIDWYEHTIYRLQDGKITQMWPAPVGLDIG